jgi:hypothetical protein
MKSIFLSGLGFILLETTTGVIPDISWLTVVDKIGTTGFAIAVAYFLYQEFKKERKERTEEEIRTRQEHRSELKEMREENKQMQIGYLNEMKEMRSQTNEVIKLLSDTTKQLIGRIDEENHRSNDLLRRFFKEKDNLNP